MGDVIVLSEWRAARARRQRHRASRPRFFFNLASPLSYLSAERVDRVLGNVEWIPATLDGAADDDPAATRAHAETLAIALRIPLVWPDGHPSACPRVMRAAVHAADVGAGVRFALAAGRLAFCGGFDLEDSDILAEAAAAAGISPELSLAAADDPTHEAELQRTGQLLGGAGVRRLPAICTDGVWLDGELAVAQALALTPALRTAH
jgi:2-hydroxychromene-2-carboxylate isomerase